MNHRWIGPLAPLVALWIALGADAQEAAEPPAEAADPPATASVDQPATSSVEAPAPTPETVRELRTIEEDVHGLKERVFRSKATLQLLKELVIEGATMGSRVNIWHVNRLGGAYGVESIQYFLDGKNIYSKVDPSGSLDAFKEVEIREATVAPGQHNLLVRLVLRGNGFGVFSYLKTYKFRVQSSYTFEVGDGRVTTIRVVARPLGGMKKSYTDRPGVEYEERSEQIRED